MDVQLARPEPWPALAKALLIALGVIVSLPWIFMLSAMASTCLPMMNSLREMMGGGMMR